MNWSLNVRTGNCCRTVQYVSLSLESFISLEVDHELGQSSRFWCCSLLRFIPVTVTHEDVPEGQSMPQNCGTARQNVRAYITTSGEVESLCSVSLKCTHPEVSLCLARVVPSWSRVESILPFWWKTPPNWTWSIDCQSPPRVSAFVSWAPVATTLCPRRSGGAHESEPGGKCCVAPTCISQISVKNTF